jgi:folate-binding protein YgfZ
LDPPGRSERIGSTSERTGPTSWRDYQHAQLEFRGEPVSVARIDQLGVPGFCVYLEPSRERDLIGALTEAGAREVSREALEAARIEAGYPIYGVDMTDDTIPLEAGIEDRAISLSKGCYVGQEVIIRVLHRGHGRVARKLVTLRIDGRVPERGARLFAADRDVGFVTSAAASPRLGTVAMAYVHRDFVAPGTTIEAAVDSGRVPATVTERVMLSGA